MTSLDTVLKAEWEGDPQENAEGLAKDFRDYLEANRDEIEALTIFYAQPHRRRELTFEMIREVFEKFKERSASTGPFASLAGIRLTG